MSTLQVANLHFESTANNRIQNINSTAFAIVAGGANAIIVNSTSAAIVGGIVANGSVGTAGNVLISGGSAANAYWGLVPASSNIQIYTADSTWTKPSNLIFAIVEVQGAGGGTGGVSGAASNFGASAGGGAGGYCRKIYKAADLSSTETVTVGVAGTGGTTGAAGSNGTASVFKGMTANGGLGSAAGVNGTTAAIAVSGVAGGAATGGDLNITGGPSTTGFRYSGTVGFGSVGGKSFLGHPGLQKDSTSAGAGSSPAGYGSGGGGSVSTGAGAAGTNGGDGVIIITEILG